MGAMISPALMSSAHEAWNTPTEILDLVRMVGPIVLDPCSNAESIVGAVRSYRLDYGEDGLKLPWDLGGLVYVNPPYGREIAAWCARMGREAKDGVEIVALVPSRTDAAWFQDHVARASVLCFWRGRLTFGRAIEVSAQGSLFGGAPVAAFEDADAAPFPSVIAYWGTNAGRFLSVFEDRGLVVVP
jgi:site-specific DNA-methyltransferase (adenine-specific)